MASCGCPGPRCRAVCALEANAAPRPASEASWSWLDCTGRVAHFDPDHREAYLDFHEAARDTALAFGYQGA